MNLQSFRQEYGYQVFFKKSDLIKLIVDLDNLNIVDANESACEFYRCTYDELLSLNFNDLDLEQKDNIRELMINKIDLITRHRISTCGVKDIKIKVDYIAAEEKQYAGLIIHDISNEKYVLTHLINHTRELQTVLDNLPFMAWFKNVKGQYTVANNQLSNFCGYSKEEIIGHTDLDIFPVSEADRYRKSDKQILEGKRKAYIEETGINGVWREEYKCPVFDHKGNIIGTTGFNRDITHRKLKDKALREAERKEKQLLKETIELKDNFITLITHEFKTPIAIINAAIQTMEHVCNKDLSAQALKYINKIKQNSFRQQRLVENLLDITRLKAGMMKLNLDNIEIVELTKEIVDSVKVVALRKDIRINFKSTIECEWVKLDFEKYERIVLNLLSNAIKYTPAKKNINVKLSIEGFFIKLEIKDRGIGIASDKQDVIFDKFEQIDSSFSRQAEGTGIGLYLVRSFTEALGGTVSLVSKEDRGSTFTVLLPKIKEISVQNQMIQKDVINKAVSIELSDII